MRSKSLFFSTITTLAIVGLFLWQFQNISDWWILKNYTPPANIVKLAKATTMTDQTKRLFYINRPELDDKVAFNSHCRDAGEKTIVLGCYINGEGIYLLDVTDPRLAGVVEVTAAHEVLHAEYSRLSSAEKNRVDQMTKAAYSKVKDARIRSVIEQYRKKDASSVPSELHSILGTEVDTLPSDLENYYKQYFIDRSKVVNFSKQYEQAFVDIKNQVNNYDARLANIKSQIETNESTISSKAKSIENERNSMDTLLSSGQTEAYNDKVASFNQLVNEYNGMVTQTQDLIDQYNSIVNKRNKLASTQAELVKELDSTQFTRVKR